MKKDELLHLHSLLALVREEFERRGDAPPAAFSTYDELDASPVAVYAAKDDHERAVVELARALAAAAGGSEQSVASPAR